MCQLDGITGGVGVHCDGGSVECMLPAVHQALNRVDQSVLRDGVEEAHKVVVDCVEVHRDWNLINVGVEMVP